MLMAAAAFACDDVSVRSLPLAVVTLASTATAIAPCDVAVTAHDHTDASKNDTPPADAEPSSHSRLAMPLLDASAGTPYTVMVPDVAAGTTRTVLATSSASSAADTRIAPAPTALAAAPPTSTSSHALVTSTLLVPALTSPSSDTSAPRSTTAWSFDSSDAVAATVMVPPALVAQSLSDSTVSAPWVLSADVNVTPLHRGSGTKCGARRR
jgi:hypothetical protein